MYNFSVEGTEAAENLFALSRNGLCPEIGPEWGHAQRSAASLVVRRSRPKSLN